MVWRVPPSKLSCCLVNVTTLLERTNVSVGQTANEADASSFHDKSLSHPRRSVKGAFGPPERHLLALPDSLHAHRSAHARCISLPLLGCSNIEKSSKMKRPVSEMIGKV